MHPKVKRWIGISFAILGSIAIITTIWDKLADPKVEATTIIALVIYSGMVIGGIMLTWFPNRFTTVWG